MSLHPTPNRLRILVAVRAGEVERQPGTPYGPPCDSLHGETVTARMAEMERAGWVTLSRPTRVWSLTTAGHEVLDTSAAAAS